MRCCINNTVSISPIVLHSATKLQCKSLICIDFDVKQCYIICKTIEGGRFYAKGDGKTSKKDNAHSLSGG